jgi:hypothetical protein
MTYSFGTRLLRCQAACRSSTGRQDYRPRPALNARAHRYGSWGFLSIMHLSTRAEPSVKALIVCCYLGLIMVTAISVRGHEKNTPPADPRGDERAIEPASVRLQGDGGRKSIPVSLAAGLAIFDIAHVGENNLIVHLFDPRSHKTHLVFNEIGTYSGNQPMTIERSGQYQLDIDADGTWSLGIKQPRPTQGHSTPHSFAAKGNVLTDFLQLKAGQHEFKLRHTGQNRFRAVLVDRDGRRFESIVSVEGVFDGVRTIRINHAGLYFLNVTADGDWTIDVQ